MKQSLPSAAEAGPTFAVATDSTPSRRRLLRKVDWYLFTEVAGPFLAAQAIFVVLFIGTEAMSEAVKLISRYGLPWWGVMQMLLLRLPWALGWTMPMSVGMAVILALGRLSRDTEYTAMVVGGASFKRLMLPLLLFATLVTGVAIVIQEWVGPVSMRQYQVLKTSLQSQSSADLENVIYPVSHDGEARRVVLIAMVVSTRQGLMNDVTLVASRNDREELRIHAREAQWQPEERTWLLLDGFTDWTNATDPTLPVRQKFDRMTVSEASKLAGYEDQLTFEASPNTIAVSTTNKPDYLPYTQIRQRIRWMEEHDLGWRDINRVRLYLYKRYTLATSCFTFLLLGAPLAVRPQRGASSGGAFALAVFLIAVYYILWNTTSGLAENSQTMPFVWAWSTNVAGAVLGLLLMRRVPD